MNLPKTDDNDINTVHKNNTNTHLDIWPMFLSEQVLHRLIEATQVTSCFRTSRRPCAKYCWQRRQITYQLLPIGLPHKPVSVQDVGHNMLNLHAPAAAITQSSCNSMLSLLSNDAELNRQFPFGIFLNKILPDLLKLRTKAEKPDIQFLQHA